MSSASRVLYVAGAGRSGSTALSLLLDRHPHMVSVSQLEWIARYGASESEGMCTCGSSIRACTFWNEVVERFGTALGVDVDASFSRAGIDVFHAWQRPRSRAALNAALLAIGRREFIEQVGRRIPELRWNLQRGRRNLALFDAIAQTAGRHVVVDASKIGSRMKTLYLANPERVRIVWLVRDGRAVTWSAVRRIDAAVEKAALGWVRANLGICMQLQSVSREHWILVRYEDLCRRPEKELARIQELVGVEPVTLPTTMDKRAAHFVGGNPMRYDATDHELALDERWKSEMGEASRRRFDRVAGWLNRRLGYGAAGR